MDVARWVSGALASLTLLCTAHAHAHIKILKPASWLNEDDLGGPQKGSPCGPGNKMLFIGDDVQPVPVSGAVTTFHAGETVTVQWQETIYHPGYFRIAFAKTGAAAATTKDFPNPALTDLQNCHYDKSAVQTVPHDNVLADGLFMATDTSGDNRSLMQAVKLPSEPCEKCTLQIVQVMEGHPGASCFYFHCAEIKILPADAASADGGAADAGSVDSGTGASGNLDSGATGGGSVDGGTAGSGSADAGSVDGGPASSHDDSGCSLASAGALSACGTAWWLLALASLLRLSLRKTKRSRL